MKRRNESVRPMTALAAVSILAYVRKPDEFHAERLLWFWDRLPTDEDHAEAGRFLTRLNPAAFAGRFR